MKLKTVLIFLLLNIKISLERRNENYLNTFFDYNFNWDTEKNNLRQRFLDKRKQNKEQDIKIQLFDNINSNKTLFVEGIMHLLDDNSENVMENSFRNVIMMNGSKYIFKRDFFWRTWREVKNESGYSSVICYKCQSFINETCVKCRTGGYWVIEEKLPKCPYEILSLKTEQESCVVNYTQYFKQFNSCPSSISLRDLQISCGNPVETKWQILKTYKKNFTERNTAVICQGRENCDILTLYSFLPDYISFRIINSTNNVFYSRIMKAGNKNYICINDCGIYDPKTKKITKIEKPLTVDLLKNVKKKRENSNLHKNYNKMNRIKNNMLLKNGLHYKEPKRKKIGDILKVKDTLYINNKRNEELATKSQCKKIEEQYLEIEEDDSYDYDFNEI